jgi:hypothetical protein
MLLINSTVPILNTSDVCTILSDHPFFKTVRVVYDTPSEYRLVRRDSCTYVLQGAYRWTEGIETGIKWIDLPTIDETNP